jgi:hypothetical protein
MAALTTTTRSPVEVEAHLDPELSRWLWLVKWFLAIPHLLVLAVLWLAFAVLTVVAGVSIALTGVYPRGIFDFNLGVLRWTWRVQLYAFTLATDRYPPFTLDEVADYPARLDVAYPERLSRGAVWVKWWLLAIPHYLVVAVFTGGAGPRYGGSLIGILCLIAGVALAVTGRYPRSLFDLVMGLCRWCWRVTAYVAQMRDEYPPFRLDVGGEEAPTALPPPPPPPAPVPSTWSS